MDLDLLKTFLEVRRTRHFGQAAENLFLTQAAVSARIKQLERMLGAPLFTRYRNNLQLTATGERLVSHAEGMLHAWEQARQDLDPRKDLRQSMEVGGTRAAWELLPRDRLPLLFDEVGYLLLRLVSHREETLVRTLMERRMDVALMHEPAKNPELLSVPVISQELHLLTTLPHLSAFDCVNQYYVEIEWGVTFSLQKQELFPSCGAPMLHIAPPDMALDFLTRRDGAAYLPAHLAQQAPPGRLHRVDGAPVLRRTVFAVYHRENRFSTEIERIIKVLQGASGLTTG